ncbi:uncharacterized protein [Antedon mediterranea]|uniref:uncharacterized protein n=1 Tax=Antedon mediterranea TaxID=105859 RepID=UPI003AF71E77
MSLARAIPIPSPNNLLKNEGDIQTNRPGSPTRCLPVRNWAPIPLEKEQIQSQIDQQTWTHWKGFSQQLDELTNWLSDVTKQLDCWKKPSDDVFSLRVQLEKHLAFALQIETHQQEKERIITSSKLFLNTAPLQPYLNETIRYIEIQWKGLKKQLAKQHKLIEEALTIAEMCISNGSLDIFEGDSLTYEQTQDVLDQIGLRLRSQKSIYKLNDDLKLEGDAFDQQVGKGFPSSGNGGLMDSGYGSSPDFEVLYDELNEWLEEMQGVLTDNNNVSQNNHICKSYDSEMQIHDITRSFLENKAVDKAPSSSIQNQTMSNVNTKWEMLERSISCNREQDNDVTCGEQEEKVNEKETSVEEIEEMISKLKAWLTETERKLFAPESRKCLGHVTHLERRLDLHKAIQNEISDHSGDLDTVLCLCDALQVGTGASEKKKESLQLAVINLERRWDAIQSQSINLQCGLDEKLRVFKGVFTAKITKDPLDKSNSLEKKKADDSETTASSILITPSKFYENSKPYRPTPSQDDVAVYRSTKKYRSPYEPDYDDVLLIREAFSENDAFSISDISDVVEDDFEYDDVLPLKRSIMSSNEADLSITDLSNSSPIITIPKTHQESTSDIEFWSVSPKDEMEKQDKNERKPKIIKAKPFGSVLDFEVVDESDYLTDASQDSFNNVFILPLFNPGDECNLEDEEILSMISDFEADMENAVEDVQADHVIAEIKEVLPVEVESCSVERASYNVSSFTYTDLCSLNSNNNNNNESADSSSEEDEVITYSNKEDEVNLWSTSNTGTKSNAYSDRPQSVCSGYESLESKSFWCSQETEEPVVSDTPMRSALSIKARKVSDMRRRFSSSSTSKHDDLMEISDISLVHMVESVNHATLLANSICDLGRNGNWTNAVDDSNIKHTDEINREENKTELALDAIKENENQFEDIQNDDEESDVDSMCTTNTSELLEALEDVMDELAQLGNEPIEDLNLEPLITDVYEGPATDLKNKDGSSSSTYSQTDSMDSGVFTGTELSLFESTNLHCVEEISNETDTTEMNDEFYLENDETDLIISNEEQESQLSYKYNNDDFRSRSIVQRVVKYALPIQILLSVYMILILVIPSIIETSGWECSLSINNKAFFESLTMNPILKYIKGPPPT